MLDFYGSHISIRNGRVMVPGGASAESAWKDLAGASPDSPKEFVARLLAKDDGWLAAYFDTLSRLPPAQQAYFTDAHRLPRFYDALRGKDISPGPARPVFRPDPGLLLLVTRLQFDSAGQPIVPGKSGSVAADSSAEERVQGRAAVGQACRPLEEPRPAGGSDVRFFAAKLGRRAAADLPHVECDRRGRPRDQRLSPETVRLLAEKFSRYGNQYLIFSEFQGLNDASIAHFLGVAERLDRHFQCHAAGQRAGHFQVQRGLVADSGATGSDFAGRI